MYVVCQELSENIDSSIQPFLQMSKVDKLPKCNATLSFLKWKTFFLQYSDYVFSVPSSPRSSTPPIPPKIYTGFAHNKLC